MTWKILHCLVIPCDVLCLVYMLITCTFIEYVHNVIAVRCAYVGCEYKSNLRNTLLIYRSPNCTMLLLECRLSKCSFVTLIIRQRTQYCT